jgi:dTDP-glucose 4,6-dehydratase
MAPFRPGRILVTGGAGFIGSNLVRHLLESLPAGRVVTLDALTYAGSRDNLADLTGADRHLFIHGDICDQGLVAEILREHGIDTVVHLAAESHVDRSIEGPAPFVQTNVIGTYTLLEMARRAWGDSTTRRFLHVSTDEVFGSLDEHEPPFTELSRYAPNSPYAATKAGADHLVRAYHRTYGLPVLISNCSNNFGPRQHGEKLIPTVIRSCLSGSPIPVYGDGKNVRDWIYVMDHCQGLAEVLAKGKIGRSYNLGGGNECSNIDLVRAICDELDAIRPAGAPHARLISFVKDRPGHDRRYAIDGNRTAREIGWKPRENFTEALRRTIRWYLECR